MRRAVLLSLLLLTPLALAVGVHRAGDPTVEPPPGYEVVEVESESVFVITSERR